MNMPSSSERQGGRDEVGASSIASAATHAAPDSLKRIWSLWIALFVALEVWILCWFGESAASMADIWWRSETFAHGLVVYPIAAWLIWQRRAALLQVAPKPSLLGLTLLAGAGFGWLLSNAGGVQAGQHFFLVVSIGLVPWALLGTDVVRRIAFPLLFTFFAAPIGEFLMPWMMQHTADVTISALRLSGIPVYREGLHFVIPSGRWSVVEACSGLRYLIASVMLGCLFAYLTYRSIWRRLAFIAISVVTPVFANWVRAYMIVMIGHLSDNKLAAGVDHLIYGWVFFGIVMLIMFRVGMIWREQPSLEISSSVSDGAGMGQFGHDWRSVAMAAGIAGLMAAYPLYAIMLEEADGNGSVKLQPLPSIDKWHRVAGVEATFKPRYTGSRAQILETYDYAGSRITLFVGYYASQSEGRELINFSNTIIPSADPVWKKLGEGQVHELSGHVDARETVLLGGGDSLKVWHWYWVGGRWTGSREMAKVLHAFARLTGWGDHAAIVAVYTRADAYGRDLSSERLREFLQAGIGPLTESLIQARAESRSSSTISPRLGDSGSPR